MSGTEIDFTRYPVLAVDDEPDNLDVIRYAFKRSHPLLFAQSGSEAMSLLEKHQVAAIVSDQRMPAMTGLELLGQARKMRPDAVGVLLTAYGDVPMLAQAINSGLVYRYVQKPFEAADQGSGVAQANLAAMYAAGDGVPKHDGAKGLDLADLEFGCVHNIGL